MKKKKIFLIFIIIILIVLIVFMVFRNLNFGYYKDNIIYDKENGSQTIVLGIPKLSFMKKENDKSYSIKNLRSNKVVFKEVKDFLNTLEPLECNNTIYYYDSKNAFTIIEYSVKNKIIYNNISYKVVEGNYCYQKKLEEYSNKLGGLKKYHTLNGGKISLSENWDSKLEVLFLDGYIDNSNENYEMKANLQVYSYKRKSDKEFYTYTLEDSIGTFEIKDDKLYYTRTDIKEKSNDINIPEVSEFEIKDHQLILVDNYLSNYIDSVILK